MECVIEIYIHVNLGYGRAKIPATCCFQIVPYYNLHPLHV